MQSTLEQEPAIRRVLSNDRKASHLVPTWQDVDILEVHGHLTPTFVGKLYNCHHSKAVTVYNVRFSFIIKKLLNKSDGLQIN